MPLTDTEISRLADMTQALRPEWPARTTRAYLAGKHRARAFGDTAVALAAVCADPASQTPAVIELDWPWLVAAAAFGKGSGRSQNNAPDPGDPRCGRPGHQHEVASGCRICAAEAKARADEEPTGPPPLHLAASLVSTHTLCGVKIRPGMRVAAEGTPRVGEPPHAACLAAVERAGVPAEEVSS